MNAEREAEARIDAALDSVLRASGSGLRYYTMQLTLDRMRDAMRKIMSDSYIAGSNDAIKSAGLTQSTLQENTNYWRGP